MLRVAFLSWALLWAAGAAGQTYVYTDACPPGYQCAHFDYIQFRDTSGSVWVCPPGWVIMTPSTVSTGSQQPNCAIEAVSPAMTAGFTSNVRAAPSPKCPADYTLLRDDGGKPVCARDLRSPE